MKPSLEKRRREGPPAKDAPVSRRIGETIRSLRDPSRHGRRPLRLHDAPTTEWNLSPFDLDEASTLDKSLHHLPTSDAIFLECTLTQASSPYFLSVRNDSARPASFSLTCLTNQPAGPQLLVFPGFLEFPAHSQQRSFELLLVAPPKTCVFFQQEHTLLLELVSTGERKRIPIRTRIKRPDDFHDLSTRTTTNSSSALLYSVTSVNMQSSLLVSFRLKNVHLVRACALTCTITSESPTSHGFSVRMEKTILGSGQETVVWVERKSVIKSSCALMMSCHFAEESPKHFVLLVYSFN